MELDLGTRTDLDRLGDRVYFRCDKDLCSKTSGVIENTLFFSFNSPLGDSLRRSLTACLGISLQEREHET